MSVIRLPGWSKESVSRMRPLCLTYVDARGGGGKSAAAGDSSHEKKMEVTHTILYLILSRLQDITKKDLEGTELKKK